MKEPGRTMLKLAEIIKRDLGIVVDPYEFWIQQGYHRQCDGARWGAHDAKFLPEQAAKFGMTHPFKIHSWDTMTGCVKYGIVIVGDPRKQLVDVELCQKESQ